MLSTSPLHGIHGTEVEDALTAALNRLEIAFDAHPHHLPEAKTPNFWRKCLRGERRISLELFVLALLKAARVMGGASFAVHVFDPILALFGLEATPRGAREAQLKTAPEESFDAHRATVAAEHTFDVAAADGEITETERREITHRVVTAQEELGDLIDVAAVTR